MVSSFQTQYGIRLSKEIAEMQWEEFKQLLSGIGPDTPLGRIVAIRSETDKRTLKRFTKEQRRIRNRWLRKKAQRVSGPDMDKVLEGLKQSFIQMAGR
ncbi:MAG: hypothetical protein HFI80_11870 [Lachnospiraceae bacterium]|uniref:Uncharacterized protein n=1 Tax=Hominisplanchenecus murintestinalis TaxID=2941517 RepID=A0AC61QV21_9FIRM|nr:Gp15 family bacteriophage protein [Hominisplanchenecus murintestinalis]MCI9517613.1 hypothetical protein [Lachnospiraceae bacterium]RKJ76176.1 hypothetical protein D7Y41_32205 [Anaerotruncus sp. 1XD22-93]MCI9662203.1 hypothetical protein [Lachnospiraceae bacterium]NBH99578.1 hypothetical protein [Lachnospiraceae bacterium]NBI76889.1 hypothetical protein [Lachnospiraceae bacterium]